MPVKRDMAARASEWPEHEQRRCGVVILNYNGWQDTIACAESVLASDKTPSWVIIVDNASTDTSVDQLRQWVTDKLERLLAEGDAASPDRLVLMCAQKNHGYAAGNNIGIRLLMSWGADAVWLLNSDTVVDSKALGAMMQRLFSRHRPGLCGARVQYMGKNRVQCRGGGRASIWTALSTLDGFGFTPQQALRDNAETIEARINFIYGASVMASRRFIETVGLMDERYFLYCEEQDWAYSAKGMFDLAYAADAIVWHREGSSTGHSYRQVNVKALLLLTRSRVRLTLKHAPWALPTVCLSIVFATVRMGWRRLISRPVRF